MRFMLLICGEGAAHKAMEADGSFQASCHAWADELRRRGMLVATEGLRAPDDATTVRVRGDQVLLTDGPFADTKEVIGDWTSPRSAPRTPSRRRSSAGRTRAFPAGPARG